MDKPPCRRFLDYHAPKKIEETRQAPTTSKSTKKKKVKHKNKKHQQDAEEDEGGEDRKIPTNRRSRRRKRHVSEDPFAPLRRRLVAKPTVYAPPGFFDGPLHASEDMDAWVFRDTASDLPCLFLRYVPLLFALHR